jgi:TonB-linked SusC/RagA family outer membrane protein
MLLLLSFNVTFAAPGYSRAERFTVKKDVATVGEVLETVIRHGAPTVLQQRPTGKVTGRIVDEAGVPLVGVAVLVKGTTKGVTTDGDGNFELSGLSGSEVLLRVTYLGKVAQEVSAKINSRVAITLMDDVSRQMEEVVVTGYATLSKERAAGSFGRVGDGLIGSRHAVNLSTALQGTVAGLKSTEHSDGSVSYSIRGISTLFGEQQPLVVVDGFPVANGFADINPNDVKDVTILKDAAAASIWGARSANGVIVVTTKNGKMGYDKQKGVNVEVNTMVRFGQKLDLDHVLTTASSADQVTWEKLAYERGWKFPFNGSFDGLTYNSLSLATELLEKYYYGDGSMTESQLNSGLNELASRNNKKQIKKHLLHNPLLQQYNISISSHTDKAQNYLSAMYEHETGNVINNKYDRFRLHYNNKVNVFKWLDLTLATNLHYTKRNTSGPTAREMRELSPYEMILNEDGSYATQLHGTNRELRATIPEGVLPYEDWTYNILREARGRDYTQENLSARVQAALNFKLFNGLDFMTTLQYELDKGHTRQVETDETFYVRNLVNTHIEYDQDNQIATAEFIPKGGIMKTSDRDERNYMWRNQLNFRESFEGGKHIVSALAGIEMQESESEGTTHPWVFGYNEKTNASAQLPYGGYSIYEDNLFFELTDITGYYLSSLADDLGSDALLPVFSYYDDRYVSVFANASYTFDNRYGITGSVRSDASNLITDDASYRWAPFWSVGGLWNITNEGFMEDKRDWLERLALRFTYGFNGNVDKSTSHKTLLGMSSSPSTVFGEYTASVTNFGNPHLRWEKTSTVNLGIDYSFRKGMFYGSVDIYNKQGKDVIGEIALAGLMGTKSQKMNSAEVYNRGVEIEFGFRKALHAGIHVDSKITYAYNKNRITKLFRPNTNVTFMLSESDSRSYAEGYPVYGIWAFEYLGYMDGVPHVTGPGGEPSSFYDYINGQTAKGILKYMGPSIAPHDLGWRMAVSGYGFNLSLYVTGQFGGFFRRPTFGYNLVENRKTVINKFVSDILENKDKNMPGLPPEDDDYYYWSNFYPNLDIMVESSSFLKLKEINLEYALSRTITDVIGISSAKIYTQLRDLGCLWTKNSRHFDPEWLPGSTKPVTTYLIGLNFNF